MIVYIDGYNLYHGLIDAKLRTSRWLDLVALSRNLLEPQQDLHLVRYFTTRVRNNPAKLLRQNTFIDALTARGSIELDFGHFLSKQMTCNSCKKSWQKNEEKKTDVNIAVRLLEDAFDDRYDTAIVISGDSDLTPPLTSVKSRFPSKRLIVAFPPKRHSAELGKTAHAAVTITPSTVRQSRMAATVTTAGGVVLQAPHGWLPY